MNLFSLEDYSRTKAPYFDAYKANVFVEKRSVDERVPKVELFDGEVTAKRLHAALHGLKGDTKTLIAILSRISQYQRSRIISDYKSIFGRKLSVDIKDILGGDFGDACLNIISDPKIFLTKYVHNILIEFPFPREEKLVSILSERTNEELQLLQETYQKRFGKTLDKSLNEHLDSEGAKMMKILVNPLRQEDWTLNSLQAHIDAQSLMNLGLGISYGDSSFPVVYSLLRKRSFRHLRNVFAEYERLSGAKPWNRIEPQMKQSSRQRLILIMEAVNNPGLCTAKVLHKSIRSYGEFSETLLCIRLSRSKEFYKAVEHNFNEFYGLRISDVVRQEVAGEMKTLLLSLIDF